MALKSPPNQKNMTTAFISYIDAQIPFILAMNTT